MYNHLQNQTSPYLLQHAENPVEWYPWGEEAFARAEKEDKPVFLSIGYSTCHWCHVMAHESFEDAQIAEILNQHFISIKVDKEERPDIDSIYMSVCQAFTGSGGWPTTILLTPKQKPFFAGTYFPKTTRYGQTGLLELLLAVQEKWQSDREELIQAADEMVTFLRRENGTGMSADSAKESNVTGNNQMRASVGMTDISGKQQLIDTAVALYKRSFDKRYGGFGDAPKFPTPHNLLFLLRYYEESRDKEALQMAEHTLLQMYRGGIFDHIGGGFSRYSTDRFFLVPHFEKMLYDNALLILAYCKAYQLTQNALYRDVAEKTAGYILREMTSGEGGFYCAQDADSEGVEGKYYLFEPAEIIKILGEQEGEAFNRHFDITDKGNFEGKSIPNLLQNEDVPGCTTEASHNVDTPLPHLEAAASPAGVAAVYQYRKNRFALHLDDKILTGWNGLMIAAMCHLYRITANKTYLAAATKAQDFLWEQLWEEDTVYVSYRKGKRGGKGFLDDYANEVFALLALYGATLEEHYLKAARQLCEKVFTDFHDGKMGGFFLYGKENEQLILRPKETYDGAIPSGNSVMAYNLVQLYLLTGEDALREMAESQLQFMSAEAAHYPAAHAMFLVALSDDRNPPAKITVVVKEKQEVAQLPCKLPLGTLVTVLENPTKEYPLLNDRTTYYVCEGRTCKPPVNEL